MTNQTPHLGRSAPIQEGDIGDVRRRVLSIALSGLTVFRRRGPETIP